jgi:peptide/nickel transport system substrate-binding protein
MHVLAAGLLLLTACAAPAAPAKPAEQKPAAETKPTAPPLATSAPTAAAVAKPADAPKPAEAAKPAAAASVAAPIAAKGQIVVAVEGEPENGLMPKMGCSLISDFTVDNVYERLTIMNDQGKIVGALAESFESVSPTVWRFKLRRGITFHNGEQFNADAVLAAVDHEFGPAPTPGRCKGEYSTIVHPAKKVDDFTVELTTSEPDPLLPAKLMQFKMAAPNWVKTTPEDRMATTAVGTGAYTLVEWQRGSHILLRANPNYWGNPKPKINEIKIVPRKEAGVRAAMVQAGEAQIAFSIPPEAVKSAPKSVVEKTTEMVGIRLNTEHPALKDKRVRQAIAQSIDTVAIMKAFYEGYSTPADGHMVRSNVVGFNSTLKPYALDQARAKQLVQEAGVVGTPLELVVREANFARITELGEAIGGSVSSATGLKLTPRIMEAGQWRESLFAVKPGEKRSDLLLVAVSNPTFDSLRVMDAYYHCAGRFSHACDEAFTQKFKQAATMSGGDRDKAFQELWKTAYDEYWFIPLFGLDFVHGTSAKLKWTPRPDGNWFFAEMELQD